MNSDWPVAHLDAVERLHILASANPGAMFGETVIAAPFSDVWAVASDLEVELPRLIHDLRSARVTVPGPGRLELHARGHLGQRARFDVELRPGWCWLQSRYLLGGMAATAHPDGTRFAFVGGVRTPGIGFMRPLLQRVSPRMLRGVLQRFERDVEQRLTP